MWHTLLRENGIKSIILTSSVGGQRLWGSNRHLSRFLKNTKYTEHPGSLWDELMSADNMYDVQCT